MGETSRITVVSSESPRRDKDVAINPNDGDDVVDDWVVIAQAQRILSARYGITFDEGARLLTRKARRLERPVNDIARSVIDTSPARPVTNGG